MEKQWCVYWLIQAPHTESRRYFFETGLSMASFLSMPRFGKWHLETACEKVGHNPIWLCKYLPTALPACDLPDAFADCFIRKLKTIRDELDSQMPVPILPTDGPYTQSSLYSFFEPVSMQCVKNTILQSSQKTCSLDPLPTFLFVECLEQLLPAVTAIINQSLHTGVFPSVFKEAIIKPLLKKPSLDPNSLKNYRPISSLYLLLLSKVTEHIVLSQLSAYLNANNLFPTSQSAYRPGDSTETALLNMMNDILHALDNGDVTVITLLDLSAAFDTIDHNILSQRLDLSKTWAPLWNFWYTSQLVQIRPFQ